MNGRRRAGLAALLLATLAACRDTGGPPAVVIARADTVVTQASELLGVPTDLAVDHAGRLYVVDQGMSRIVRVEPGRGFALLGRAGQGPGEFSMPQGLSVADDTLRVDDRGNQRVVVLDGAGKPARSYSVPPRLPGVMAFGPGGDAAVATLGFTPAGLAQRIDSRGRPVQTFGRLVAPHVGFWNFTAMKAEVRRGRVPTALRNNAIPVLGEDGGAWLVLAAEGEVQRFDAAGRRRWARPVTTPEVDRVRDRFFALNRAENDPAEFYMLQFFSDAVAVGDMLWVLVATAEDEPAAVVVVDGRGAVQHRYVVPALPGATALAVDAARRQLYLTSPASAMVVRVALPPGE
ncbi:MAG: hypothetical protein ABW277_14425 [Longimicrobiaceae bacterium]